jgi:hypothetical protein
MYCGQGLLAAISSLHDVTLAARADGDTLQNRSNTPD